MNSYDSRKIYVIDWKDLKDFTKTIFIALGMSDAYADLEADMLVWSNLHGIDSHGVLRVPWYAALIENGQMDPKGEMKISSETPATMIVDANLAPGPAATVFTIEHVIRKAGVAGICWGVIRNLTHQGPLSYYTLIPVKAGMIGIAIVCSPPNMAPYGAKAAGVHNSPISIAVPGKDGNAVVLDMATSIAAGGKIYHAKDSGTPIPLGWALNKDGDPTTDPNLAKIWLPFERHKGSGLAMMFECITSVLVNNPLCSPVLMGNTDAPHRGRQNSVVAAIDISAFTNIDTYRQNIDDLVSGIKHLPRSGTDEIMVPGEPEKKYGLERKSAGIPLPEGTVRRLCTVADKYRVSLPAAFSEDAA